MTLLFIPKNISPHYIKSTFTITTTTITMNMSFPILLCFCLGFLSITEAAISSKLGINYGVLGNNLPSLSHSIELIKSLKAHRVKLYDADPQILTLLSNTTLQISIMIPNQQILQVSSNQSFADEWVRLNILPFHPKAQIRFLLVGNEVLSYFSDDDRLAWAHLVPAMYSIKNALNKYNLKKIKVSTPLAMDVLQSSFPPSNASFRSDVSEAVISPLLHFLNRTSSFFFLDVYPYFPWSANPAQIQLSYALLEPSSTTYVDPGTGLTYTNLLDQMLDAVNFAMENLGYRSVRLLISETGWPNNGDIDQIGANIYNAATYNRNLISKITKKPLAGTPARPGVAIPTFIFSLYNENQKTGPGTERNWGVLYPNGSTVYEVDLMGKMTEEEYAETPLPAATNNEKFEGRIWCVVAEGAERNTTELNAAITYACAQVTNVTCAEIEPGRSCYEPDSVVAHANFAFSAYWKEFRSVGGTCYFNGLAIQSSQDPGNGSCTYPSVIL